MTPRQQRLEADYRELRRRFDGDPNILIQPEGLVPPERYLVVFKVPSLRVSSASQVVTVDQTVVTVILPSAYPKERPFITSHDPVFHPNFGADQSVCIADYWVPAQSLADIIVDISDMLQMKKYNVQSPLNAQAAEWAVQNASSFPLSSIEIGVTDLKIHLGQSLTES